MRGFEANDDFWWAFWPEYMLTFSTLSGDADMYKNEWQTYCAGGEL